MAKHTYEEGFGDGRESVAGKEPLTGSIIYPPEGEAKDYHAGFLFGRAEAEMHFKPSDSDHPEPTGL
jgi:hypothetical protein